MRAALDAPYEAEGCLQGACRAAGGDGETGGFVSVLSTGMGLANSLRKTESASAQQGREQLLGPGSSLETALSKKLSGSPSLLRRPRRASADASRCRRSGRRCSAD